MIRLLLILILIIIVCVYTIIDYILVFFISFFNKEAAVKYSDFAVKIIFKIAVVLAGVKAHILGQENIESLSREKSYFVISNHRGFCDVVRGYLIFDRNVGIVAKKSLGEIPILSYWMKKINCLFLDRENLRDGFKMVVDCINNLKNGTSMWIFPEGTRCTSDNPSDLLEFKAGVFKIPEKVDCYILPIAFKNTEYVFEKQKPFIKATEIYINIGKPYKISELNDEDKQNIGKYSQDIIKKLIMEV